MKHFFGCCVLIVSNSSFAASVAIMDRGIFSFLKARPAESSSDRPLEAAPIAFVHMPKTSGQALIRGLIQALKPAFVVQGFDRSVFGNFGDFETISGELRAKIHLDAASMPPGAELIAGHFALSTLRERYPSARTMTILREPVSRVLSHWLYWRAQDDASLAAWGTWAKVVRQARDSLADFLASEAAACQLDNYYVRAMLWPHPKVPNGDFIDRLHDDRLVRQAAGRLKQLDFADVLENPSFHSNLESWTGRPVDYPRFNETAPIPTEFKSALHDELTPLALNLLEARTRLDRALWTMLARRRLPDTDIEGLRERALIGNVARHSWLMIA
jgi:hypothetical protein